MNHSKTILIVDDQIDFRESLARTFTHLGYHVFLAENGREALEYLLDHSPPMLILLDLRLPGSCGLSFRKARLREPALAGVPVVIASDEPETLENARIGNVMTWRRRSGIRVLISLVEDICQTAENAASSPIQNSSDLPADPDHCDGLQTALATT